MTKKYELTDETKNNGTLHRIRALRDIPRTGVKAGDIGGWIKSESQLSHDGECWVYGNAVVSGNAEVCGNAVVCGNAEVRGLKDYITLKNVWSSGRTFTYTRSNRMWKVGCFCGTGEELIVKAYKDSNLSGRCYEASVKYGEEIYRILEETKGE